MKTREWKRERKKIKMFHPYIDFCCVWLCCCCKKTVGRSCVFVKFMRSNWVCVSARLQIAKPNQYVSIWRICASERTSEWVGERRSRHIFNVSTRYTVHTCVYCELPNGNVNSSWNDFSSFQFLFLAIFMVVHVVSHSWKINLIDSNSVH